ncbi:MAG: rhodanese-like domain-containing protein, partial [Nitrospiraceae bacterium]
DLNIDFGEIQARHRDIGAQLEDRLVVYCQSGHRSNIAAETLADLGYRHVYNVTGSMNAWLAAGFPVESGRQQDAEKGRQRRSRVTQRLNVEERLLGGRKHWRGISVRQDPF